MEQQKMDRISELTRIARQRELTAEEKSERQALRGEYLSEWRTGAKAALDSTYLVDEKGVKRKLMK